MTADATRVIDDLGPLHRLVLRLFVHQLGFGFRDERELYHAVLGFGRGFPQINLD